MRSTRSGRSNWRGEMLIDSVSSATPASSHAFIRSAARRSTHSPICTIRPVFSASGMKRPGGDQALGRAPAHQRLDPERARPRKIDQRLELQREFVARQRPAQADLHLQPLARLDHVARLVDA